MNSVLDKVVIISVIITSFFCVMKFLEMKYIDNELKPLKYIIRDAFMVSICSVISTYLFFNLDTNIMEFFNIITNSKTIDIMNTNVFTDDPGF